MKLVDANVLIYAVSRRSEHHDASVAWLDSTLSGDEGLLLPWISLVSFIRITTHPSINPVPISTVEALDIVEAWLAVPSVITGEPDRLHARRMSELLRGVGTGGNLVNDAYLAALARQYGATVVTYDRDFALFSDVRWERPTVLG